MPKSKNFFQNLMKPFKFGSSNGNWQTQFIFLAVTCNLIHNWAIYYLCGWFCWYVIWLNRGTKWRGLGEDCCTGTEAVSIWDLGLCYQRFPPNSQTWWRWIWTCLQGKDLFFVGSVSEYKIVFINCEIWWKELDKVLWACWVSCEELVVVCIILSGLFTCLFFFLNIILYFYAWIFHAQVV